MLFPCSFVLAKVLTAFVIQACLLTCLRVCVCLCVYAGVSVYTQQKERTINILHKCRNKRLRQDDIHTHTVIHRANTHTYRHTAATRPESCTCSWVFWTRVICGHCAAKVYIKLGHTAKYLQCCQCCKMLRNSLFAIQRSGNSRFPTQCDHPTHTYSTFSIMPSAASVLWPFRYIYVYRKWRYRVIAVIELQQLIMQTET